MSKFCIDKTSVEKIDNSNSTPKLILGEESDIPVFETHPLDNVEINIAIMLKGYSPYLYLAAAALSSIACFFPFWLNLRAYSLTESEELEIYAKSKEFSIYICCSISAALPFFYETVFDLLTSNTYYKFEVVSRASLLAVFCASNVIILQIVLNENSIYLIPLVLLGRELFFAQVTLNFICKYGPTKWSKRVRAPLAFCATALPILRSIEPFVKSSRLVNIFSVIFAVILSVIAVCYAAFWLRGMIEKRKEGDKNFTCEEICCTNYIILALACITASWIVYFIIHFSQMISMKKLELYLKSATCTDLCFVLLALLLNGKCSRREMVLMEVTTPSHLS